MIYQYSAINSAVDSRLHDKITLGFITAANVLIAINNAAKYVYTDLNLRTAKRKSTLTPRLFKEAYEYAAPTDLKALGIIDVRPQATDIGKPEWRLTSDEEFQRKRSGGDLIAVRDESGTRKLLISLDTDDDTSVISELDSLTSGGGTWTLFGDGTNLTADTDNYIHGNGCINWDISSAGGTTAGIYNSGLNKFDVTNYLTAGSAFVWVYNYSATNLTNYILRVGSDSSNYYSMTVTTDNAGNAFSAGWNLIRWDFSGKSTTGTPDDDQCDYVAMYMTKDAAKVSETDYRFDYLVLKKGDIWEIAYYSKYPWQNTSGTWLQDSTDTTDYINADADEYNLVIEKAVELVAYNLREGDDAVLAKRNYTELRDQYLMRYPSEALVLTSNYYEFNG